MTSKEIEQAIQSFASVYQISFGDAMKRLSRKASLEIAADALGLSGDGEVHTQDVLRALGAYLDYRGFAPPKSRRTKPGKVASETGEEQLMDLTKEQYIAQRKQGLTHEQIAKSVGVKAGTLAVQKSKWGIRESLFADKDPVVTKDLQDLARALEEAVAAKALDALAEQAVQEYEAGETQDLCEVAAEMGVDLEPVGADARPEADTVPAHAPDPVPDPVPEQEPETFCISVTTALHGRIPPTSQRSAAELREAIQLHAQALGAAISEVASNMIEWTGEARSDQVSAWVQRCLPS